MQLVLVVVLTALLPLGDAAGFLNPQHAALVAHTIKKDMPVTSHSKTAGDGYKKGSPLYGKQQELEKNGAPAPKAEEKGSKTSAALKAPTVPGVPQVATIPSWEKVYGGEKDHVSYGLSYFCSYFILTMLVALIWIKCTVPGRTKEGYDERKNNALGFAYGMFSFDHCLGHHGCVCLCSWCCAPLRLADTYSKEPASLVKSFWAALVMITCLLGLQHLTFGFTGFLFLCVAVYFRQGLRKKYGLEAGGSTYLKDFVSWLCCPFCSMAQEARQVEFVLPIKR